MTKPRVRIRHSTGFVFNPDAAPGENPITAEWDRKEVRLVGPLMVPDDLDRVRKQRDKQIDGGGAWQTWDRILRALTDYCASAGYRVPESRSEG